jgi:hypothetical protein
VLSAALSVDTCPVTGLPISPERTPEVENGVTI